MLLLLSSQVLFLEGCVTSKSEQVYGFLNSNLTDFQRFPVSDLTQEQKEVWDHPRPGAAGQDVAGGPEEARVH